MTQYPDYMVPTGDFIAEWMEGEGIKAAELARRLDVSRKHVSELLRGKAPLSHGMALGLESVTGVPARIWNLHEVGYREAIARRKVDEDLANQYDQAKEFPLKYLRDNGFITAGARDRVGTVRDLLKFLGVSSFDAFHATWREGAVAYRRSALGRHDSPSLAAWLRAAELGVIDQDLPPYDRNRLEEVLEDLRALTVEEPAAGFRRAQDLLRECGVILVLIPAVPGLGVHGATRWFGGHPLIQLSGLWKSDDQLWFTLFHEIGHVLLHDMTGLYLSDDEDEMEQEANEFASHLLVPPEWEDRLPRGRNISAIRKLADEIGVAPSVVLGQAQRRTGDYAWGNALKRKVTLERREDSQPS
ncbi:ImmA/IrrE family metallo-endopeptidase [Actinomyces sp. zg296]|uniref:ImmA/IrrE family metallo-endopeptidase n=1 Tax=Actinomyces sp. zg296 TaxID=2609289 RepID=UPI001356F4DE|nr:ImmA/IrrE family metallo-endopeptidase [Actinomyces sp. zg296]